MRWQRRDTIVKENMPRTGVTSTSRQGKGRICSSSNLGCNVVVNGTNLNSIRNVRIRIVLEVSGQDEESNEG